MSFKKYVSPKIWQLHIQIMQQICAMNSTLTTLNDVPGYIYIYNVHARAPDERETDRQTDRQTNKQTQGYTQTRTHPHAHLRTQRQNREIIEN